jgi:integrase
MAGLTVKSVETARAASERREIADAYMRGLYLVVQPTGSKSWAVRYRHAGKSHKGTLGPYPAFDLKQARDAAAKVLRAVAEGRDPRQRQAGSVEDAVAQFLQRHCKSYRPKSRSEAERLLRLYVVDKWGRRKLDEITRADVRAMLDGIDAPVAANRTHSVVRKFFNWAVENDLIAASPVAGVRTPHEEKSRDRVLTDNELRAVWNAADKAGVFGSILKLLILTGQRRSEMTEMEWAELDLEAGLWTLPRERVKNDRRHEVPLSRQAVTIIKELPRIGDGKAAAGARYVFSLNGRTPFNGFKTKERFDAVVNIAPWTIHDLRRTAASGMARLGVSLVVIEKVLNHVSGSLAGIVGVYQRHEFAEEKRATLQQWADHVERVVGA